MLLKLHLSMSGSSALKVVCALIFEKGLVLATRRDPRRSFPLMWEFPGGKLENGELPEEALHRELEEELKLKVEVLEPLPTVNYQNDGHHIELIPYLCRPAQRHAPVPVDHVEVRWIQADEADHLTWAPADIPLVGQLKQLALLTHHE
jgi:8-oxo-dGTP diphosphatase